jgi:antagonist of KipI
MPSILIHDAGPQTTVQDLGRRGSLRVGIPPSGPMDREAFLLANRLVGNADDAAGLECTFSGPRIEFADARWVAITGAEMRVTLNGAAMPRWAAFEVRAGDVLRLGPARLGVRGYLAVSGGINTPPVLGSRSTYLRGQLGGFEGRALSTGDCLPLGPASGGAPAEVHQSFIPDYTVEPTVRVVLGPQDDRFTKGGIMTLFDAPYEMTPQIDRMGARLRGARIEHARGHDIVSDGVALGGIQVVGDGQPIMLLADRQSTGGYTKIGAVCSFDIGRVCQVKPGQRLRFRQVSVAEAHEFLRAYRRELDDAVHTEAAS